MTFSATIRSMSRCRALYTSPMPPSPSLRSRSYWPNCPNVVWVVAPDCRGELRPETVEKFVGVASLEIIEKLLSRKLVWPPPACSAPFPDHGKEGTKYHGAEKGARDSADLRAAKMGAGQETDVSADHGSLKSSEDGQSQAPQGRAAI